VSLIVFDIGNTNITFGSFNGRKLDFYQSIPTQKAKSDFSIILSSLKKNKIKQVDGIVISNVVPPLDRYFKEFFQKHLSKNLLFVNYKNSGLKVLYRNPREIGADRIANAVAGYEIYKRPLIIIDFGTAITFDCVDSSGRYLGGIILPGIRISAQALAEKTAKLPYVEVSEPESLIGRSTKECISSGIYYGTIGAVKEIIFYLKKQMGKGVMVIATGGDAGMFMKRIPEIKKNIPKITLYGLKIIWEKNRDTSHFSCSESDQ